MIHTHLVEFEPFIKSQLASSSQLQGVVWCKFGHVTPPKTAPTKPSYSTEWVDDTGIHREDPATGLP